MSESSDARPNAPLGATFHFRDIPEEEQKSAPGMEGWAVKMMGIATFGRVSQMAQEMMAQAQAEDSRQSPPVSANLVQYASKEGFENALANILTEKPRKEDMDPESIQTALDKLGADIRFLLERAKRQEAERSAAEGNHPE